MGMNYIWLCSSLSLTVKLSTSKCHIKLITLCLRYDTDPDLCHKDIKYFPTHNFS